ncbi:MAG: hypothetical protein M2R45_01041 [Verrucomicrobia subdivision 3 bacterium]|nr:hypothetical protein [Limisphaerales bacterium]MCS1414154.1 hypothetical protein [Limisphaerales bacterium]
MNWSEADAFCQWLTQRERRRQLLKPEQQYRLPRDTEWSVAVTEPVLLSDDAEAGAVRYPWGLWPPKGPVGNYERILDGEGKEIKVMRDPFDALAPAGSFPANWFGVFNLGGNVWEWCESPEGDHPDGRVIRGGSWKETDLARTASEFSETIESAGQRDDLGFRVVLALGMDSQ